MVENKIWTAANDNASLLNTVTARDLAEVRQVLHDTAGWYAGIEQRDSHQWIAVDAPDGSLWAITRDAALFHAAAYDTSGDELAPWLWPEAARPVASEAEMQGANGLATAALAAEVVRRFVVTRSDR